MNLDDFSVPLQSGLRRLSDDEQEQCRRDYVTMMRRLQPKLDAMDRARRRAEVEARFAVIA